MKTLEIRTDILVKVFLTVILIFGLTNMSYLHNIFDNFLTFDAVKIKNKTI
jgi:hypothetical protein